MKNILSILPALAALHASVSAVEYEADILPIFQSKCSKCHMDGSSKGGIALDLDKVIKEVGAGKAIVPGDPGKSDLFEVVSLPDDDGDKMPPEGKGSPLSTGEIAKLKEWMEKPDADSMKRPDPIDGNWTNTSGKTIKATLIRVDGDKAILRMGAKDYPYPIKDLNADSQSIIRKFAEDWNKASGN
jgi:hypothetical protein